MKTNPVVEKKLTFAELVALTGEKLYALAKETVKTFKALDKAKTVIAENLKFDAKVVTAKRLTVVFLDDIGQSPPAVQAALMQLILARRVNGHRLSDHVVFCGATNDTMHLAGVAGLCARLRQPDCRRHRLCREPPAARRKPRVSGFSSVNFDKVEVLNLNIS